MAQETIQVRVRNVSSSPQHPIFAAYLGERLICGSSCDIRAFAILLAGELARIAHSRETEFALTSEIEPGQKFDYAVKNLLFKSPNLYEIKVLCEKLPPPGTLSRKFYDWFSGKSRPRR